MEPDFQPTHRITFTDSKGHSESIDVVLDPGESGDLASHADAHLAGPAYTEQEWYQCSEPDWTLNNGEWRCLGLPTPGGEKGTITVVRLSEIGDGQ